MVTARGLQVVVWQERKQVVGIFIAVFKLDKVTIGFEALVIVISCGGCWNDPKEDVFFHEMVQWSGVTCESVDQNFKISVGERSMGLDQSIRLAAVDFFLQLEQNVFLVFEEGVDNLLSICSSCETPR